MTDIIYLTENNSVPQTSIRLANLVKENVKLEKMMEIEHLSEENVIKFLSDVFYDDDVKNFLTNYYDKFYIDDDRVIIISDTHLGGLYGSYDALESIYEYAYRNNIKNIIHAGDIIEGYVNPIGGHKSTYDQLDELKEKYPRDNTIKTHYILGNHDYLASEDKHYQMFYDPLLVKNTLDSIINLYYIGVLESYINFFDEHRIKLFHTKRHGLRYPNLEHDLTISGHSHVYRFLEEERELGLPPLCLNNFNSWSGSGFAVLSLTETEYFIQTFIVNEMNNIIEKRETLQYRITLNN